MHDFPAGRFAVWATAWLSGRASYDDALDALAGDTAHRVTGLPGTDEAVPLGWALTALRGPGRAPVPAGAARARRRPRRCRRCPAWLALAARRRSGRRRRAAGAGAGGAGPRGRSQWTAFALDGAPPVAPAGRGVRCARSPDALDLAVGDAARTLAALDVARWNPEVPALLAGLGEGGAGARRCPTTTTRSRVSVLGRAQRLAAVLDLAMADAPGAAVNHAQAARRDDALRPLARAVREATVAAQLGAARLTTAGLDPRAARDRRIAAWHARDPPAPGRLPRTAVDPVIAAGRPRSGPGARAPRPGAAPAGARLRRRRT